MQTGLSLGGNALLRFLLKMSLSCSPKVCQCLRSISADLGEWRGEGVFICAISFLRPRMRCLFDQTGLVQLFSVNMM